MRPVPVEAPPFAERWSEAAASRLILDEVSAVPFDNEEDGGRLLTRELQAVPRSESERSPDDVQLENSYQPEYG